MPIWLKAILGLLAIIPCVTACWREDALVVWEERFTRRMKQREEENHHGKEKVLPGRGHKPDRTWGDRQVIRF